MRFLLFIQTGFSRFTQADRGDSPENSTKTGKLWIIYRFPRRSDHCTVYTKIVEETISDIMKFTTSIDTLWYHSTNLSIRRRYDSYRIFQRGTFYEKVLLADDSPLKEFKIQKIDVDELSILYGGDTAIAFGDASLFYKLTDGSENTFKTRWTSTLVKDTGNWTLAAFHNSVDFTNNPLINIYSKWMIMGIIGALLVGLLIGFFFSRFKRS